MAKPVNFNANPRVIETTTDSTADQVHTMDSKEEKENSPAEMLRSIIGAGIAGCMKDRTYNIELFHVLDQWFSDLPADRTERIKLVDAARAEMETAKLATEEIYMRFRQLAVNAKG